MRKVRIDDTVSVITVMLWPHYVYLIITNMTNLTTKRTQPELTLFADIYKQEQ